MNAPQTKRKLVGYEDCRCILTQYCDGKCRPIFADVPLPDGPSRRSAAEAQKPNEHESGAAMGTRPAALDDLVRTSEELGLYNAPPAGTQSDTERDAARLDWMQRQDLDDLAFGLVQDAPHDGEYIVNAGAGPYYGKTFRAAIDAAMGNQSAGKESNE